MAGEVTASAVFRRWFGGGFGRWFRAVWWWSWDGVGFVMFCQFWRWFRWCWLTLGGVEVSNLSCFVSFESILVSFSHFSAWVSVL